MTIKKLGLAVAAAVSVTALAGCPTGNLPPGTGTGNASVQGRLFFSANQPTQNPGSPLTVRLRQQVGGNWSRIETNTTSDASGNYSFTGLPAGTYQILYDDSGTVAATDSINTSGIVVSDPVTVQANQTSAPQVSMDLAWDLAAFTPDPSSQVTSRNVNFSWTAKPGFSGATYQVSVFGSQNTGGGAIVSSTAGTGTTASVTLPDTVADNTTVYYVVKYWKAGGDFGGGNYYGQTKPIPITLNLP